MARERTPEQYSGNIVADSIKRTKYFNVLDNKSRDKPKSWVVSENKVPLCTAQR
jgi:hypothetical protein